MLYATDLIGSLMSEITKKEEFFDAMIQGSMPKLVTPSKSAMAQFMLRVEQFNMEEYAKLDGYQQEMQAIVDMFP